MLPDELTAFEAYLREAKNRDGSTLPETLPSFDRLEDACACVNYLWSTGDLDLAEVVLKSFAVDGNPNGHVGDVENMLATWPATDVPEFEAFRRRGIDIIVDATGSSCM